jgi:hypothetical protein
MKKTAALASALRGTGARVAHDDRAPAPTPIAPIAPVAPVAPRPQASRIGTKPITMHLNEEARRQLKALAGEEGRTVESMGAEALNLLFARYRKAEVAVAKGRAATSGFVCMFESRQVS